MKTSRRGFLGFLTGGAVAVGAGAVLPKKSEPLPNPDDYCGISDAMLGEPLGERVTATEYDLECGYAPPGYKSKVEWE